MSKRNSKIEVKGVEITFLQTQQEDFICITDIAKYKNPDAPADIIKNWLRSKNTIELLGLWERLHNPDFKLLEFDQFRNEADVLNMALFGKTAKQWRDENPNKKGNIHDYANVSQLVCLANLENLNAVFIDEGILQSERLHKLNQIAIGQMRILLQNNSLKMLNDNNRSND